jgi:hypothetical protein
MFGANQQLQFPQQAWHVPKRSRISSPSSPPRKRPTSPARSYRSMVAPQRIVQVCHFQSANSQAASVTTIVHGMIGQPVHECFISWSAHDSRLLRRSRRYDVLLAKVVNGSNPPIRTSFPPGVVHLRRYLSVTNALPWTIEARSLSHSKVPYPPASPPGRSRKAKENRIGVAVSLNERVAGAPQADLKPARCRLQNCATCRQLLKSLVPARTAALRRTLCDPNRNAPI